VESPGERRKKGGVKRRNLTESTLIYHWKEVIHKKYLPTQQKGKERERLVSAFILPVKFRTRHWKNGRIDPQSMKKGDPVTHGKKKVIKRKHLATVYNFGNWWRRKKKGRERGMRVKR